MFDSKYVLYIYDLSKVDEETIDFKYLDKISQNYLDDYLYQLELIKKGFAQKYLLLIENNQNKQEFIKSVNYCVQNECTGLIDQFINIQNVPKAEQKLFNLDPFIYVKAKYEINSEIFNHIISKEIEYYQNQKKGFEKFLLIYYPNTLSKLSNFIKDQETLKETLNQIYENNLCLYDLDDFIKILDAINDADKADKLIELKKSYDINALNYLTDKSNLEQIKDMPYEKLKVILCNFNLCKLVIKLKEQKISYDLDKLKSFDKNTLRGINDQLDKQSNLSKKKLFNTLITGISNSVDFSNMKKSIELIFSYQDKINEQVDDGIYEKIIDMANCGDYYTLCKFEEVMCQYKYVINENENENSKKLSANSFFEAVLFIHKKVEGNSRYDNKWDYRNIEAVSHWLQSVNKETLNNFMKHGHYSDSQYAQGKKYFSHYAIAYDDLRSLLNERLTLDDILTREIKCKVLPIPDTNEIKSENGINQAALEKFLANCISNTQVSSAKKNQLSSLKEMLSSKMNNKDIKVDDKSKILKKLFCTAVRVLSHHNGLFSSRKFSGFANSYNATKDQIKELYKNFGITQQSLESILKSKPSKENCDLFMSYKQLSKSNNNEKLMPQP